MTQKASILAHFQAGGILTPLDALNKFNCWSLAQVVFTLKSEGHIIETAMINNQRTKKCYASYKMPLIARPVGKQSQLEMVMA